MRESFARPRKLKNFQSANTVNIFVAPLCETRNRVVVCFDRFVDEHRVSDSKTENRTETKLQKEKRDRDRDRDRDREREKKK